MTFARLALLSLVTGVSQLAIVLPAQAQDILFTTAVNSDGSRVEPGRLAAGLASVRGGITQLRTADGAILSFVGDATFDRTTDGLRIAYGNLSARAGAAPLVLTSADGSQVSVAPGSSASLSISAQGEITGRALTGRLETRANGEVRTMAAGEAFAASSQSGVSRRLSLAAQPIVASQFASQELTGENPLFPRFASLLATPGNTFTNLRAAGLTPSSEALAILIGAYLDHLAAGRDASTFPTLSPSGVAAALDYIASYGLPASLDPLLAARITAFRNYLVAGGSITSPPSSPTPSPTPTPTPAPTPSPTPTPTPTPTPAPTPSPSPTPTPTPAPTMATWSGSLGGDAGKLEVGTNAAGAPIQFGPSLKVGTAQLVEVVRGSGWIVGRYADGTMIQTRSGSDTPVSYGPTDGQHFGFATSALPATIAVGTATYSVAGFTRPTYADQSAVGAASLTGAISLNFATLRASLEGVLDTSLGGATQRYVLSSSALSAEQARVTNLSGTLVMNIQTGVQTSDARCVSRCSAIFALGSSGVNAGVLAGTYTMWTSDPVLRGAVVFGQTALVGQPIDAPFGTRGIEYRGLGIGGNLVGIDAKTVILGSDGKLDTIDGWNRGTAKNYEAGGVAGVIGWTRWAGGTIQTTSGSSTQAIAENAGRHLVWYRALTAMPTSGTASYALAGGTSPARALGEQVPGRLNAGALTVDFAAMKAGLDLSLTYNGMDFALGTVGGTASPSAVLGSNGRFDSTAAAMSGNGCTAATCFLNLQGALAGDGASHAAITYAFSTNPGGSGGSMVQGVAAFARK